MTLVDARPKPGTSANEPLERAVPVPAEGGSEAGLVQARVQVLFRHTIREGLVNPLLHLVPPYRLGEAP